MKMNLLLCFAAILVLGSCKKVSDPNDPSDPTYCDALNNIHITATTSLQIGQTIKLSVPEIGGYRIYSWIGPNNYTNQYPDDSITYASLKHEGWYYLNVTKPDCNTKFDSVYVDILLNQGTPACNIAANACTFSNLFDDNFTSVHRSLDPGYGVLTIAAYGTADMKVLFHPQWNSREPEDGIYNTINVPTFDQVDGNYNKVFISTVKQGIYFASHPDQQVYVSHLNGKLQVRFCALAMSGSNGTTYNTAASGNLVDQ